MSRTYKDEKGPGYEYWGSRLNKGGDQPGEFTKKETHKKERREAKKDIKKNNFDNLEKRESF